MVRATGYLLAALLWIDAARSAAAERPNVLRILADDCTYNDLPLYGGKNARTPNIDRLAGEGLTFDKAYLTSAMCQPARAELYTGQYPMQNGCAWNHSASRPTAKSLPHHLGALGYGSGLAGNGHVEPAAAFPFERIAGFDPNCVRDPTRPHRMASISSISREIELRFSAESPFQRRATAHSRSTAGPPDSPRSRNAAATISTQRKLNTRRSMRSLPRERARACTWLESR